MHKLQRFAAYMIRCRGIRARRQKAIVANTAAHPRSYTCMQGDTSAKGLVLPICHRVQAGPMISYSSRNRRRFVLIHLHCAPDSGDTETPHVHAHAHTAG